MKKRKPNIFFFLSGNESKARDLMALPWTNINAQYANGNTPLILAVQGDGGRGIGAAFLLSLLNIFFPGKKMRFQLTFQRSFKETPSYFPFLKLLYFLLKQSSLAQVEI